MQPPYGFITASENDREMFPCTEINRDGIAEDYPSLFSGNDVPIMLPHEGIDV